MRSAIAALGLGLSLAVIASLPVVPLSSFQSVKTVYADDGGPGRGNPNPGGGNPGNGNPNPGQGNPNPGGGNPGQGNPNPGQGNPGQGNPNPGNGGSPPGCGVGGNAPGCANPGNPPGCGVGGLGTAPGCDNRGGGNQNGGNAGNSGNNNPGGGLNSIGGGNNPGQGSPNVGNPNPGQGNSNPGGGNNTPRGCAFGNDQANGQDMSAPGCAQQRVTICHATGSATNPFVEITVAAPAADEDRGTGHGGHENDIIPAPAGGCPTTASIGSVINNPGGTTSINPPGNPNVPFAPVGVPNSPSLTNPSAGTPGGTVSGIPDFATFPNPVVLPQPGQPAAPESVLIPAPSGNNEAPGAFTPPATSLELPALPPVVVAPATGPSVNAPSTQVAGAASQTLPAVQPAIPPAQVAGAAAQAAPAAAAAPAVAQLPRTGDELPFLPVLLLGGALALAGTFVRRFSH